MAWIEGNQIRPINEFANINEQIANIEGYIEEDEAKVLLYKFFRHNITYATNVFMGVKLFPFQHLAIKTMLDTDYTLNIWSRGLSKCEKKGSLVFTNSGIKKIEDVEIGDYILSKDNMNLVEDKVINPKDKIYKVKTKKGYESGGLDYHRVLTLNKNLEQKWKYSKDLKRGDCLIMRKNHNLGNQYDIFEGFHIKKTRLDQIIINPKNVAIEDWYYFFGLLIGDGCFTDKIVSITSEDIEIENFLISFSDRLGLNLRISKKENNSAKSYIISNKSLKKFLIYCGFKVGVKSGDKVIPQKLLKCSDYNASRILSGLFDTDGYASISPTRRNSNGVKVGYTSTSMELIKQVRFLLLLMGIESSTNICFKEGLSDFMGKKYHCNQAWSIVILGYENIKIFKDKINFNIKRKKQRLNVINQAKYKNGEFSNYIPFIGEYLQKKTGKKSIRRRREGLKLNFRKNTSKKLGKTLYDFVDEESKRKIEPLLNDNLFFDFVESIEEDFAETVDLQVKNEHCYVSDGVISHNSFSCGIYAVLDAIFNQGIQIGILSAAFRQSKQIFRKIEDIASKPEAVLLNQLIGNRGVSKGNDEWILKIGDSTIRALPLGDGCLAPNTLIHTDSGFHFIEDLFPKINLQEDHQEFPVNPDFAIKSHKGFLPSDQKFYNGIRDTLKITTNLGYEIEGTLNHKFKVVCPKTGDFIWKSLEDITHEDYLVMSANESWHRNETNITEEEAYATGLLIGDGSFKEPSKIGFATEDHELAIYLENANIMKNWTQCSDKTHYCGTGGEQMKQNFMSKMGISNDHIDTLNKRFPSKILQSNKKIVANFISGLFDSDGGIQIQSRKGYDSCCVSFYNSSKILIQQLHQILLHFGIKSNFDGGRERKYDKRFGEIDWNTAYALQITGVDVKKFYEEIGFKLKRKQDLLESFCQNKKRWFNIGKNDHINCMREILVNEITQNKLKPKNKNLNLSKLKKKKYLTQQCLESYIQNFGIEKKYSYLINDGVFFQQVDSIVESKSPTYDLHVPSTHEYNASGFIVHNSKLRGFRFHRIIIDEMLLMPERIYNEVILPFLAVTDNPDKQEELAAAEDILIAQGKMKEEDRYVWPNNKLIALSSASYKFEYLYKFYKTYENLIMNPDSYGLENEMGEEDLSGSETATRAIIQLSYDCAPRKLYDKTLIKQSIATMSQSQFDREFGAKFTDDSSGYFKISRMANCTVPYGQSPSVEVVGDPDGKYILAFDPNWAENDSSDDFALHLFKLNDQKKMGTVVHSYALSNTRLKEHMNYFMYVLKHFNVVMIIGDYMGGLSFMNSCNESKLFIDEGIELRRFEGINFDDVEKYQEALEEAAEQYKPDEEGVYYVHLQNPSSGWIRRANEHLQGCFDHQRVQFAADAVDAEFAVQKKAKIPINNLKFRNQLDDEELAHYEEDMKDSKSKIVEFIEHQTDMIDLIKAESALIQITTSPQGTQTFDLPKNLKNQTGPNKTRKDSYSAMVLGNWMVKLYYGFTNFESDVEAGFIPRFIK